MLDRTDMYLVDAGIVKIIVHTHKCDLQISVLHIKDCR